MNYYSSWEDATKAFVEKCENRFYKKDFLISSENRNYSIEKRTTGMSKPNSTVMVNGKRIKREEIEPPAYLIFSKRKRFTVAEEKENRKSELAESGKSKNIITMDSLKCQTSEFKKLYGDKFDDENATPPTTSRLLSSSQQRRLAPYGRKNEETKKHNSSTKRADTVVSNSVEKVRNFYDNIRSVVAAVARENEKRFVDRDNNLDRKNRLYENTPFCALSVHGLRHLMHITVFYNYGIEDLLKNVTFKATKLCCQCSRQTCCNKIAKRENFPKFSNRNFRFSYGRQSRSFNSVGSEKFLDEKRAYFDRLRRRAIKYDLKIDRMQKRYIDDLAVQNVFHLYCLSSWAGESGATESQMLKLLNVNSDKKPNENDLCVKALLNCYNNRH